MICQPWVDKCTTSVDYPVQCSNIYAACPPSFMIISVNMIRLYNNNNNSNNNDNKYMCIAPSI